MSSDFSVWTWEELPELVLTEIVTIWLDLLVAGTVITTAPAPAPAFVAADDGGDEAGDCEVTGGLDRVLLACAEPHPTRTKPRLATQSFVQRI